MFKGDCVLENSFTYKQTTCSSSAQKQHDSPCCWKSNECNVFSNRKLYFFFVSYV